MTVRSGQRPCQPRMPSSGAVKPAFGIFKLVGWESEDRSERGNEAVIIGSDIAALISTTELVDVHGITLNRRQPPGFPPRAGSGVTLCTKTELSKDTGHCKLCRKLPLKQGNFGGSFLSVFCTVFKLPLFLPMQ